MQKNEMQRGRAFALLVAGAMMHVIPAMAEQASVEKGCAMWAAFGRQTAESRDSGTTERGLNQKIDALASSGQGFTRDNALYAKAITKMVFHDFRKRMPAEIATLVHIGCLTSK